ncbi:MAG: signal peptide peptidase SppA [Proteobacteria bacterium]|nr:signal peptide peptidase SppA [Pseudomonadota bacterium]MCH8096246.1 signal peptide peptidase SppA [Pseudomonadota bacterium]
MSLDADALIDRRRLKRRLALWRTLAVLALVTVVVVGLGRFAGLPGVTEERHVARFTLSGLILDDRERGKALAKIAANSNVAALILHIDSPGGTVFGGEAVYHSLREIAEKKPVVTVMGTLATSGGYMAALATDYIFAREGSITGSIGVVLQTTDITGLLGKLGITAEAIKSGELKAVPSPFEPLTERGRQVTREVVMDMYDMFVDLVAERRKLPRAEALVLSDGRIYTGRQAVANKLIDQIGGEKEAREWLETQRDIPKSLPLRDVKIEREDDKWYDIIRRLVGKTLLSERLTLDGLVSVWHPDGR